MSGKICLYQRDGVLREEVELNKDNIGAVHGMMIRCDMKDGRDYEGFCDAHRTKGKIKYNNGIIRDVIYVWRWDHLDEETHKLVGDKKTKFDQTFYPIAIDEIRHIDAILYSNPRWGGRLTNRFYVTTQLEKTWSEMAPEEKTWVLEGRLIIAEIETRKREEAKKARHREWEERWAAQKRAEAKLREKLREMTREERIAYWKQVKTEAEKRGPIYIPNDYESSHQHELSNSFCSIWNDLPVEDKAAFLPGMVLMNKRIISNSFYSGPILRKPSYPINPFWRLWSEMEEKTRQAYLSKIDLNNLEAKMPLYYPIPEEWGID